MKTRTYINIIVTTFLTAGTAFLNVEVCPARELFHSGTTGKCEGCHAFGAFPGEKATDPGQNEETLSSTKSMNGNHLLRGSDPSSTCLLCHEAPAGVLQPQGHYVATSDRIIRGGMPPSQLTPAGDFGWLKKSYKWQGEGWKTESSLGERHGHNIVALDNNYKADATIHYAPGGTYPANSLSCISCHDPHGNYRRNADGSISSSGLPVIASGSYNDSPNPDASGSVGTYRMLAGKGYQQKSQPTGMAFTTDPPAAVAPADYNRTESGRDTRVAYGSGMSEWCKNCHAQLHNDGGIIAMRHAAGNEAKLSQRTMATYNNYLKTGDLNGNSNSSYTSMVPYEMGTSDYEMLKSTANSDGSNLRGPGAAGDTPNVMCLSCHRSHASGWDSMSRWNMTATFIVEESRYPGIDNGAPPKYAQGRTEAETRKTFYDRSANRYASYQRSLCNKCHAED